MPKQMNVLMIAVDDLRPQLGCYGDADAITPHMDRLAAAGMVFQHAYCQQAVCNPSRASLMTGRYPDTIGVWDLRTHFRAGVPDVVTLPQHFKHQGYHSECIGKLYHDPRSMRDEPSWSAPERLAFTGEVGGKYVLAENIDPQRKKTASTECLDVPDNAYIDGRVADEALMRLKQLSVADKPFFLGVGFRRPHLPFTAPKRYWDMQNPERVGRIPNPLPPQDVPRIALHESIELRGYSDIPDLGELSAAQAVHLRHGYYAAVSYVDAQIGKLLDQLDRLGLRDHTVICLWGDHGWHLGEHGLWGKITNFELDTRSPLIISAPGLSAAGRSSRSLAEFVDVYPTLTELCGLPEASGIEGKSLVPVLNDPEASVRAQALSQFPRPWGKGGCSGLQRMGYSIRTDRWRYTAWMIPETKEVREQELYDHHNDPLETVNLAGQEDYASPVHEMKDQLLEQISR